MTVARAVTMATATVVAQTQVFIQMLHSNGRLLLLLLLRATDTIVTVRTHGNKWY